MKNPITEEVLLFLGFVRQDISSEESGDTEFHYYHLDIKDERSVLISCANDECNGNYSVDFFEYNIGSIDDAKILKKLVGVLKKFK
jgi:hypothetical protein